MTSPNQGQHRQIETPFRNLSLVLEKFSLGFSAAHLLIGFGKCDRLHGHNYQVSLKIFSKFHQNQEAVIDFSLLKRKVSKIISKLDHRILLATNNPKMKILQETEHVTVQILEHVYRFPISDVILLPIIATTCENLACYLWDEIKKVLPEFNLQIPIEETPGSKAIVSDP